jgi:hypothetical protein
MFIITSAERKVLLRYKRCVKRRQKDDRKTSLLFLKRPLPQYTSGGTNSIMDHLFNLHT